MLLPREFSRHLAPNCNTGGMAQVATELTRDEEVNPQPGTGLAGRQVPDLEDTATAQRPPDYTAAPRADTERVSVSAHISGTLKVVDIAAGTITITVRSGQQLVLGMVSDTTILVNGTAVGVAELSNHIGTSVDATVSSRGRLTLNVRTDDQPAE